MSNPISVSVVAPARDEEENLLRFCQQTKSVLSRISGKSELIIIDDGSRDNSWEILKKIKQTYPDLNVIKLRRRYGQTAALMAGIKAAQGEIIVTLDADLQQDPNDIVKLVKPIEEGRADVVTGVRKTSTRGMIARIISLTQRKLVGLLLDYRLADTNISPNAYRREILQDLKLLGEMHRYLLPILYWRGYRIEELPVQLEARQAGVSKYRPTKALRGFIDLLLIKFWQDYSARPIHFFGTIGLFLVGLGIIVGGGTAARKFLFHLSAFNLSFLLLAVFLTVIGLQVFILGILADVMIKIYYKDTPSYEVETVL